MAIHKAKIRTSFSAIPNKTLQDKSLTFEATGLLAMLLSLPEDWEIHKSWLQEQKQKCGRDKISKMVKELESAGYLRKSQARSDGGSFGSNDYHVYPTTVDWKPVDGLAVDGKTPTTKETSLQKKHNTNNSSEDEKTTVKIPYQNIADAYNDSVSDEFPRIRMITDKRKPQIKKFYRLLNSDLNKVKEYFAYFDENATTHQRGENERGWVASFDFIIREDTVARVVEGRL